MRTWPKVVIALAIVAAVAVFYFGAKGVFTTTTTTSFTAIALLVSVTSLTYQMFHTSLVQSADLLMRFERDFFGADKIAQRALASRNFLKSPTDLSEMEDILDFFETVAMFTRKHALDPYMVWHTFDYWIERYYAIAQTYIRDRQKTDPVIWEDFVWLVARMQRFQAARRGGKISPLNPEALNAFLHEEAAEA